MWGLAMRYGVLFLVAFAALPARAENFTTAAEVHPILSATKPAWIAVREFDGKDLLYFTNLLAWRCGLSSIRYSVNDEPPMSLELEPCHTETAQPNALLLEGSTIYVVRPLGSVQRVTVDVTFDDGAQESGSYERQSVMTP
jgi:hypothetical protein